MRSVRFNALPVSDAGFLSGVCSLSVILLPLLQQTVSPHVLRYSETNIKDSATPAAVYRLALEYDGQKTGPATLILKRIHAKWPDDPGFPDREIYFYTCVLPHLDIPHAHLYYTGIDPETQDRLIFMEDLSGYHFPPPTRPWTQAEGECIARAYARLHTMGEKYMRTLDKVSPFGNPPDLDWLLPRHESRLEPEKSQHMVCDLVKQKVWEPIPGLDALLTRTVDAAQTYTQLPVTLLHNDVYPPNVALPPNLKDDAILLDWEMASYGLPEMDLGFMFLQPHRAHRYLDKARVLDVYWAARHALEGEIPSCEERKIRQFYADAVWGFWLVPVAHKMAVHPFPPGSTVAVYWESMFGVLFEHLQRLSRDVLFSV